MLQHGDIISIDNDHWDLLGKKFKIEFIKYRENSTAVELILTDVLTETCLKCVFPRNQIIREGYENEMV